MPSDAAAPPAPAVAVDSAAAATHSAPQPQGATANHHAPVDESQPQQWQAHRKKARVLGPEGLLPPAQMPPSVAAINVPAAPRTVDQVYQNVTADMVLVGHEGASHSPSASTASMDPVILEAAAANPLAPAKTSPASTALMDPAVSSASAATPTNSASSPTALKSTPAATTAAELPLPDSPRALLIDLASMGNMGLLPDPGRVVEVLARAIAGIGRCGTADAELSQSASASCC